MPLKQKPQPQKDGAAALFDRKNQHDQASSTTIEFGRLPEPDKAMLSGYVLPNCDYYTESVAEMQIGLSVQSYLGCQG